MNYGIRKPLKSQYEEYQDFLRRRRQCSIPPTIHNFPTYDQYRASAQRQRFSIPDSIIYCITKNPSTPKVYQKLIQSCKYFFIKNPILVLHCLKFDDENEWKTCINNNNCQPPSNCYKKIKINKISSKIWITKTYGVDSNDSTIASNVIQKFYKCDAVNATFTGQKFFIDEFLFYSRNAQFCCIRDDEILFQDGSQVPCEKIVENLPNLTRFAYKSNARSVNNVSGNLKKLLEIPIFKNLEMLDLDNLTEFFEIDTFFEYLKENRTTKARFYFSGELSNAYKFKLQQIIDEILSTRKFRYYQYFPPFIYFLGMSMPLMFTLDDFCDSVKEIQ